MHKVHEWYEMHEGSGDDKCNCEHQCAGKVMTNAIVSAYAQERDGLD